MKRIIDMLLWMLVPMLVCLSLFMFATAFIVGRILEPLQIITVILSIIFGALFLTGFIWNIVYSLKHGDKE